MLAIHKCISFLLLSLARTDAIVVRPTQSNLNSATQGICKLSDGTEILTFHPPRTFETFGNGIDHPLSKRAILVPKDASKAFASSRLSVPLSNIAFKSGFEGDDVTHSYLQQSHNGITFVNAVANVAFNRDSKVVAFGSSFVTPISIASSFPSITLQEAIITAEKALNGKYLDSLPVLEYFVKPDHSVVLTHVMQIRNASVGVWVEAFVDAHTNQLISIIDFVAKASYFVLPIQKEIPSDGFQTLTNPQDLTPSPLGWHSTAAGNSTTTTSGNNAIAFKGVLTNVTTQSSGPLNFIFSQDASVAPTTQSNIDLARTNVFYIVNSMHDLLYRYGFTEAAFNFQKNNFGLGGVGNDPVTISVQDSSGIDDSDFTTPPDGTSGAMRMYLWDFTTPMRDGSLENDIVTHEMTHGLTNRMTGGGTARCLQTIESLAMGEGWSDAMADWNEKTSSAVPDYVLGQYVTNNPAGIRNFPYSTSPTTNPLRYSSLQTISVIDIHSVGEVWANMLHNVYASLVGAHGWSATARTNPAGTEGNIIFLHLFIDALPLQPCNPTFLTGRDAWIQADVNRYGGANKCILWNAFASRGLGVNAANHTDDTTVPAGC